MSELMPRYKTSEVRAFPGPERGPRQQQSTWHVKGKGGTILLKGMQGAAHCHALDQLTY
jgi:hypothetical protein